MSADDAIRAPGGADEPSRRGLFTIGELAREFDITPRALRFYEDRGLINPRRQGQQRLYSRRDRARLKLILMGKRVGFPLAEISEMLALYELKDGQVTQLRVALERFDQQIARLDGQRLEIEQALGELRRTREVVSGMLTEREREGRGGTDKAQE